MTDAGEWLIGTAKANPEALLVLAAGCALLMRGGRSLYRPAGQTASDRARSNTPWDVSRTTENAFDAAGGLQSRIVDGSSSVTAQAGEIARTLSAQTSHIAGRAQSALSVGFGQLLREQPLALVAAGLAAGAVVAALLPNTDLEERALGGARDAISGMAGKLGENLAEASADAGKRLTQEVAGRSEEFKELAQEVAGQFAEKVMGTAEKPDESRGNVSPLPNRGS